MSDEQKAKREEATQIAKLVAASLEADPEVMFADTVDNITGQTAHATKVMFKMMDGRKFTVNLQPVRTREAGGEKSKK